MCFVVPIMQSRNRWIFFLKCDQWSFHCKKEIKGCKLACSELLNSFISYLRHSRDENMLSLLHNIFLIVCPSPEYPKLCAVLGCYRVKLYANMNWCEFSFIIASSIIFCDVTCITKPYSVCSTFLIASCLCLPKVCEKISCSLFRFSEFILCCCWVDIKCLFLHVTA